MTTTETTHVGPRSRDTAIELLDIAEDLGYERSIVRTDTKGYIVPTDVAEAFTGAEGDPEDSGETEAGGTESTEADTENTEAETQSAETGADAPAKSASKGDWEAYAVEHHGYDTSRGLTQKELVAEYGGE